MPNLNIVFLTQVAALNQSLVRTVVTTDDDVAEMDTFPAVEGEDASKMLVRIKNYFKALNFLFELYPTYLAALLVSKILKRLK